MLTGLFIVIHVLVCLALILIILLQTTKGAGMGAAFGGASQTLFGSTGRATFLTKITIAAAVVFSLTAVGLSMMSTRTGSVMDNFKPAKPEMPELPELPPLPGEQGGAEATVPGLEPGQPGSGEPSAIPAPGAGEAGPGGLPPLPEGAIAPPEAKPPESEGSGPSESEGLPSRPEPPQQP